MVKRVKVINQSGTMIDVESKSVNCPYCHQQQIADMHGAIHLDAGSYAVACLCTDTNCNNAFNIHYDTNARKLSSMPLGKSEIRAFKAIISDMSPIFCEIYNEAYAAEQMNLSQITGVGYRKALEFLIKDYLISKSPDEAEAIKAKMLGKCISENIEDAKIKSVAIRAAWLGNDETHYIRKWESLDITHLKTLIDLCLHHIESEIETAKILAEMPAGR